MRTHLEIIRSAGGYKAVAETMGLPPERVRFWERRRSIPTDQWRAVADARLSTLEELAAATERARAGDQPGAQA